MFLATHEIEREPISTPPRSLTRAIFCAVFDSGSSFFARKPHGNACYTGHWLRVYNLDVALCLRKTHKPSPNIISRAFPFRKWGEKHLVGRGSFVPFSPLAILNNCGVPQRFWSPDPMWDKKPENLRFLQLGLSLRFQGSGWLLVYALCKRGIMLIETGAKLRPTPPALRDSLELAIDSVL